MGEARARIGARRRDQRADGGPGVGTLLTLARERAGRLGLGDRFTTCQVSLPRDFGHLPRADLIWASGVAHHLPDVPAGVRAFAGLLRDGGVLALREGGLPAQFLPSYADAGLSGRMAARGEELAHQQQHPMGAVAAPRSWPALLAEAGLTRVASRSFLLDLPSPLTDPARRHLSVVLTNHRGQQTPQDAARIDQLTDPDLPESVLRRQDVFLLRATTIHLARRL
ncbi:class I SAM-dependent methyltransferase [Actinoplanes sp. NPDC051494]|uniref:class I SAM-dependent methyltransferase n=1 Tax=Actinoplanes sp. NPDC051494 TaxID=3363907 RepID=UPI00378E0207